MTVPLPAQVDPRALDAAPEVVIEAWRRARIPMPPSGLSPEDVGQALYFTDMPETTARTYRAGVRKFAAWCEANDVPFTFPAAPVSSEALALFVRDGCADLSPASVTTYVAAVDAMHDALGLAKPGSARIVRDAKKAARRRHGRLPASQRKGRGQAAPMRLETLIDALDRLDAEGTLKAKRDAVLLALAYDGQLRVSELLALDVRHVRRDHVIIERSKTDQEGDGATAYVAPDTYERVRAWVSAARLSAADPLFPPLSPAARGDRIGPRDAARIFKARLGAQFSTHSGRVGNTKDQIRAGVPLGKIVDSGRWASPRMALHYGKEDVAGQSGSAELARMQGRA